MASTITGEEVRQAARNGSWTGPTSGLAPGFVQANLVIVPESLTQDFLLFCQSNPKPCPLLEVLAVGSPEPVETTPGADIRTDLPQYCIYKDGQLIDQPFDLMNYWDDNLVSFLLGCSFTFENALMSEGIPIRHIEEQCNVPMYRTSIPCEAAGIFHGKMVVSMRPLTLKHAEQASRICSRYPQAHGAPVHIGDPSQIGIKELSKPDYGDAVEIRDEEVPVFWACGVTPQAVALEVKPELFITHKPGHMFVTDLKDIDLFTGD